MSSTKLRAETTGLLATARRLRLRYYLAQRGQAGLRHWLFRSTPALIVLVSDGAGDLTAIVWTWSKALTNREI